MKSSLFLALCGLTATFAVPLEKKADYALKDKHFVPAQWRKVKRANCVSIHRPRANPEVLLHSTGIRLISPSG
jgi:hypothetical protein